MSRSSLRFGGVNTLDPRPWSLDPAPPQTAAGALEEGSYLRLIDKMGTNGSTRFCAGRLSSAAGTRPTRWPTTRPSKVNLPHAIIFRALRGANLVTLRSKSGTRCSTRFWAGRLKAAAYSRFLAIVFSSDILSSQVLEGPCALS